MWVTALPGDPVAGVEGAGFDLVERLDWPQALERLHVPATATDTLWLLQSGAQGPEPDGLRQALRGLQRHIAILVLLPACAGPLAHAAWLDAGADRCLPWPCPPDLLAAMLRALRRSVLPGTHRVSHFAGLRFDHEAMTLHAGEQRIALTQREAQLMSLLIRRVGQWVSSQDILKHMAQGEAPVLRPAAVQLYVHRVNRKIQVHGLQVDCLKRIGYGLVVRPAAPQQAAVWTLPTLGAHRPFANPPGPSQATGVRR